MPKASPIRTSFNAGELSPLMAGRTDVAKYNSGCYECKNFIPSVQGPAVRRAGTRYVAEVKTSSNRTWLVDFQFNATQSFVLEFGHQYIRFYFAHGQVLSGGLPYEIVSPYSASDLTNSDGTLNLGWVQSGDVIYLTHANYPVQKLSRLGNTNWTIAPLVFKNGPFQDLNTDKTIVVSASGTTGTVTLTSNTAIFQAGHVGMSFYLEPEDLSYIKPWYAGQEFANPTSPNNEVRRSDGKTYKCVTAGNASAAGKVWRTGANKPTHTHGVQADGDYSARTGTVVEREGLDWLFLDVGYGYVTITGYTSATQVTATVSGDYNLPAGLTSSTLTGTTTAGSNTITGLSSTTGLTVGMLVTGSTLPKQSQIASIVSSTSITIASGIGVTAGTTSLLFGGTTRWAKGAFNAVDGYPENVTFFRERLTFSKSIKLYFSVSGDFNNFATKDDTGTVVADRAIQITLSSDKVNSIEWIIPSQALIIGTASEEFACSENSTNEAFAPANVKIEKQTSDGSRGVRPVQVGYSTLFVQRSGRKLKESAFNFQQNGYVSSDMTVLAEHITSPGIVAMAWHKEPYACLWAARSDGRLIGFTFNKEQDVTGWHQHSIGSGIVESLCVIPNPDNTRDDLWMIVNRTINGVTKRYVEYLEKEYQTNDSQSSAFYVDSGITVNSDGVATTVTGLGYLQGEVVSILVDGAAHPNRIVGQDVNGLPIASGTIQLQTAGYVIQIGLPYISRLTTTRIEAGAGDGTAQGKTKRITKVVFRFLNTLGGYVGQNSDSDKLDEINFRLSSDSMDAPPAIFTGDKLLDWIDGYNFDGYITVEQSQPLPMTVVAIMPQVHTFDR